MILVLREVAVRGANLASKGCLAQRVIPARSANVEKRAQRVRSVHAANKGC